MTLQVTVNDIILKEDNLINEGEYNVKTINFEFSDEYTDLIKKCRFITNEEIYEEDILDNQCEIPIQVTSESGYIRIGVYAYNEIDGTLELRYSPTPLKYLVRSGSYTEDEVIVPERLIVIEQNLDSDSEAHVPSVHAVKHAIDQLDGSGFEAGNNITFTDDLETGKTIISATDTIYDDTEIRGEIDEKVDKVTGKGLSTNDYTNEEKTKLASLENYDDTQIVQDISNLSSNKADKSTTYTKSEVNSLIPDVSSFITKSVDDLVNYYKKNETYTQNEVNALIGAISTINILVVQELPTQDISTTTIYLVPKSTSETNNVYDEYIYVSNAWEKIGDTQIDLSDYVTTSALNTALANYTTTNDLTTLLNGKQNTLTAGDNITIENNVISATGGGSLGVVLTDSNKNNPSIIQALNTEYQNIVNGKPYHIFLKSELSVYTISSYKDYSIQPLRMKVTTSTSERDWGTYTGTVFFTTERLGTGLNAGGTIPYYVTYDVRLSVSNGVVTGVSYLHANIDSYDYAKVSQLPNMSNYLAKNNTTEYTPTNDYNPATKKYVDDNAKTIQYSTMPTASSTNEGDIVQYVGTTDSTYTNGYFYQCVSDGQATPTYNWTNINVQNGGGSSNSVANTYTIDLGNNGTVTDTTILDGMSDLLNEIRNKIENNDTNFSIFAKRWKLKSYYLYDSKTTNNNIITYTFNSKSEANNSYGEPLRITVDNSGCKIYDINASLTIKYNTTTQKFTEISGSQGSVQDLNVLCTDKNNTYQNNYVPTLNGHPANKKYVDDCLATKQDTLTAGDNITIENNVISATGGSSDMPIYQLVYNQYTGYFINANQTNANGLKNKGIYIKDSSHLTNDMTFEGTGEPLDSPIIIFKNKADVVGSEVIGYFVGNIGAGNSSNVVERGIKLITYTQGATNFGLIKYNTSMNLLSNAKNITGAWTFSVLPSSSVVPTNDNHFANKKYIDDKPTTYAGYDATKTQILKNVNGTLTWVDE